MVRLTWPLAKVLAQWPWKSFSHHYAIYWRIADIEFLLSLYMQ